MNQVNREYIDLNTIYPKDKIESENYSISRISLSKDEVMWELMRNRDNYWYVRGLKPDFEYVRLVQKGKGVMMTDTPMERNTNSKFIQKANGDVIIFGLGLGLIVLPLLSDTKIKSITVVELYQDLIDLVTPFLKPFDKEDKLKVVQGDVFTYTPEKGVKYDTIYSDIWISICDDNYEEQKKLGRRYSKYLNRTNPNSFSDAWLKSHYQKERIKEKRSSNNWW
jgi:hypothetical protein